MKYYLLFKLNFKNYNKNYVNLLNKDKVINNIW